jgi:hypothetical protein
MRGTVGIRWYARLRPGIPGRRRGRLIALVTGAALASLALLAASAGAAPLTGSSFDAANGTLTDTVDHDWNPPGQPAGNVGPLQPISCPSLGAGTNCGVDRTNSSLDDSFTQGPKEDDEAPVVGTGSIPPNKDDLSRFYVNQEKAGGQDFLYLAWERTATLGSAHMDFEFNQSSTASANGVTKLRTAGDILITFDFGGSGQPVLSLSRWVTSGAASQCEASNAVPCWGHLQNLTASALANGAVNSTNVLDFNPPGAPRTLAGSVANNGSVSSTFGEAAINLTAAGVFPANRCAHFGAAMLKSRSSGQSFTSSLKDFIAPIPVNITNCGQVIIRKVTDPPSDPTTIQFGYTKSFGTDPATPNTFQLGHGQSKTFDNVLFGSGYTVTEDTLPAGWDFASLDCSASTGVTPSISGTTVTFDINDSADILDCTYTNRARATLIVEKITDDGFGAFNFTSFTLDPSAFTLTTTAAGDAGKDSRTFGPLVPGTYDVAETVPAGWNLVSSTCSDGSLPGSIMLSAGETVTCTFHDAREKGAILITKTRKHAADGPGDHPQSGVQFTITGGELPAGGTTVTTDANGQACLGGLVLSGFVGDYTVHENTPSGYHGEADKTVTVDNEAACSDSPYGGESVSFHNTPLTNITMSVNSQVDGGTASTIDCGGGATGSTDANGDGSVSRNDLEPGTYTCTVVVDP